MKNTPMPASQYAQDSDFEVVPPGEVDDKVGGGVEDEGEVVEAGQAEDPRVDFVWVDLLPGAGILLSISING